ncbi:MAG: diadenylate cyclase [Bacteroidales bacterium]|nr:diadenylate cyclase [Bacteroidales bacterium]
MMTLSIFSFMQFGLADVLDIIMVALVIFFVFRWIRDSSALNIFLALILLLIIEVIVSALDMKMMTALMNTILDVGVLALVVIFQPEIRHFLNRIGGNSAFSRRTRALVTRIFGVKGNAIDGSSVNEITEACLAMSKSRTGALIVLPHKTSLDYIIDTGDKIDAVVNRRLIMNLFFKNSPLHDGAMIIEGNRIVAARCTLPITSSTDLPPDYGMRHKAAVGISEESDADVIVVSEESGHIVFVNGGTVTEIGGRNELKLKIGASLSAGAEEAV